MGVEKYMYSIVQKNKKRRDFPHYKSQAASRVNLSALANAKRPMPQDSQTPNSDLRSPQ